MIEIFKSSQYDEFNLVDNYKVSDIKGFIAYNIERIKNLKDNLVILPDDNFNFIISFFSGIFTHKNLYLISDKKKLNELDIDYDIYTPELKKAEFKPSEINYESPLINFFTSGTTDKAKCIKKSLFNLVQEARELKREFNIKKNLQFVSTTTMCHLFGLTFHLMYPLVNIKDEHKIVTKKVIYPDKINYSDFVFISSPSFLSTIKSFENNPQYIITAGAKLKDDIFSYLEKFSKIIEIYGSSESGVIAYRTKSNEDKLKIFPSVKIEKTSDCILIQTDFGYGDKIEQYDDIELLEGFLKVKGRLDKMAKIQEKRVSLSAIENALNKNSFIQESYCFKFRDKVAAICALSDFGKEKIVEIGVFEFSKILKQQLLKDFEIVPQKWRFTDIIPRLETGKIDRYEIENLFEMNLSMPVILDRKTDENSVQYKLFFYKGCNFFKGHFPQIPIVAGVVSLYLAQKLSEPYFKTSFGAGQMKRIKFSNIIKADSTVNLKLKKQNDLIAYEYFDDEKSYSQGTLPTKNILVGEK